MKTIIYPISSKYFPGVIVTKIFSAKVRYEIVKEKVKIMEVCLSPDCLKYISNTAGLMVEIESELENAERNAHVHPLINTAIRPFIQPN